MRPSLRTSFWTIVLLLSMGVGFQTAHASVIVAASREEIVTQVSTSSKYAVYIETPGGNKYLLANEDIVESMSVDMPFQGDFVSSIVSIDTKKLLEHTAERHQQAQLIPTAETISLQSTATGALIPENGAGVGYNIAHPLLEKMLLNHLFQAKSANAVIQVPVTAVEPTVLLQHEDGSTQKLEVVAHGISDFRGSSKARVHNIEVAMKRFQGIRIEPGAIFSFNDLLGTVDGSTGYQKELVIKGDRTIPDYGGGVCQVSSTVYRAALRAGFPIVERKPHSYAVSYYTPWGSDATIYPGIIDLRFENDFQTPVYMHLFIEGTTLHTMLYGISDGRHVEMAGPNTYAFQRAPEPKVEYVTTLAPGKRVWKDQSHTGFSAWWERKITSSTGHTMTEKIVSTYEARGGYVLEGKAAEVPLQAD